MDNRPSHAHIRNALASGVCPWCSQSIEGITGDMCPHCGNSLRAPLGPRDPGSPGIASLCSLLALVLILVVAFVQQTVDSLIAQKAAPTTAAAAFEPPSGQFELFAKAFVKLASYSPDPKAKQQFGAQATGTLDAQAVGLADKVRVAVISGE